jgi:hypothetical protein
MPGTVDVVFQLFLAVALDEADTALVHPNYWEVVTVCTVGIVPGHGLTETCPSHLSLHLQPALQFFFIVGKCTLGTIRTVSRL